MRSRFLLIPAAVLASAIPGARAGTFLDVGQAQKVIFPGATFTESFVKLTSAQVDAIYNDTMVFPEQRNVKAWTVSTGGWFIVDRVEARNAWITYAVGIDGAGHVKQVEVLECIDEYDMIKRPEWLAQFKGKEHQDYFGMPTLAGATISSRELINGVRRLLSTVALVLQAPAPK